MTNLAEGGIGTWVASSAGWKSIRRAEEGEERTDAACFESDREGKSSKTSQLCDLEEEQKEW